MGCCFSTTTPPNTATEQNVLATARERYTTPHAIWEALSTDHVKLLRASYLVKLAREGRVLCRRQELPPDAFIGVEELKSLYGDGNPDGVLPVLSVSFCWDTPPHPDPSGKQVATVAAALEREMPKYAKMGFAEMGVFWDWAALYQKDPALFDSTKTPEAKPEGPERDAFLEDLKEKRAFYGGEAYEQSRTPEQKEAFGRALHNTMDLWYAHQGTTVYLLTQLPTGTRRKLGYDDSGWTTYERRSAEQIKKVYLYEAKWKLVRDLGSDDFESGGAGSRNWPLDPDGFDELIESKQFTNGADKGTVKTLYRKMSKAQLSGIEILDFTGISAPSVRDMEQLGRCLNLCENLKTCDLSSVGLADDACRALFSTLKVNGVLTNLNLYYNQIGDEGAKALASALRVNGALKTLDLYGNQVGNEGAEALASALRVNGVLKTLSTTTSAMRAPLQSPRRCAAMPMRC